MVKEKEINKIQCDSNAQAAYVVQFGIWASVFVEM